MGGDAVDPGGRAARGAPARIHAVVGEAIAEHRPEALAIERLMWGRNVGSAMEVARASGVVMLAAAEAGVPVDEYAPLEVKMAVTGVGQRVQGPGAARARAACSARGARARGSPTRRTPWPSRSATSSSRRFAGSSGRGRPT